MIRQIVFYSWQSDRPNNTNRGLIQTALERAARAIRADDSLQIDPVVERDTAGVSGSPDIAATIFDKIDKSDVFVADVTLVTEDAAGRPSPNPNVLLELGYAAKSLGWNRVLLVMNLEFGIPEQLPFDLKMRKVLSYQASPEDEAQRKTGREKLQSLFERGLRDIIEKHGAVSVGDVIEPLSPKDAALAGISGQTADSGARVRRYVDWFIGELDHIGPNLSADDFEDNDLVKTVHLTLPLVDDFFRVARAASDFKDRDAAIRLHRAVELLAERTRRPKGFSGKFQQSQLDFWRFLVHEIFVGLIATMVANDHLEIALELINAPIIIPNLDHETGELRLLDLCRTNSTLDRVRRATGSQAISLHAELLAERRGSSSEALTVEQYRDGDLFVFCVNDLPPAPPRPQLGWRAISAILGDNAPRFLVNATAKNGAQRLASLLGLSVAELVERVEDRFPRSIDFYGSYDVTSPLGRFDPNSIGTR